jgi:hypothetical protein
MEYAKPEVIAPVSAIDAIQSSNLKHHQIVLETTFQFGTNAAYEADE